MKKIRWQFVPALIICLLGMIIGIPKPSFSFMGVNWLLGVLSVFWLVAIFYKKQ